MRVHSRRKRKTGPTHDLVVLRCHVHDVHITVYPPGYVPYARRTLFNGAAEFNAPSFVEVVAEAEQGVRWPRRAEGGSARWWSTQLRLVLRVAQIVGLMSTVPLGMAVGMALSDIMVAKQAQGLCERARALHVLLAGRTLHQLLRLGALAGAWGRPWWWDPTWRALVCLARDPPIVSTTSVARQELPAG